MKQEISQNDILKQYLIAHSQSPGTPSVRYNSSLETQKPIIRFAYLKKKKKKNNGHGVRLLVGPECGISSTTIGAHFVGT